MKDYTGGGGAAGGVGIYLKNSCRNVKVEG